MSFARSSFLAFAPALSLAAVSLVFAADPPSAEKMMAEAHDGRAVWKPFHGFTADVTAALDGKSASGTLRVAADGTFKLDLKDAEGMAWAERTLNSVINHRLSNDGAITNVEFVDDLANHPLGRLIKSKDAADKSLWRAKGDVLTEVHRNHGKNRFIISVAQVARTAEGKHLPQDYTVTTWNNETNAIESTRQLHNEWARVGTLDLPTRLLATTAKGDGSRQVEEIVLSSHRLTSPAVAKFEVEELAPLGTLVTSFGAAVAGNRVYAYGGHLGTPHEYAAELECNQLQALDLKAGQSWQVVSEGPARTGLALVGYNGAIYRIGGFEAKNAKGTEWNLHSSRDFARFDPATGKWTDLAPLPEGRSSHDAALLGSQLFVVGGWELKGKGDGTWHSSAYVCDLASDKIEWTKLPDAPFKRRALSVATFQGKLWVIGGMEDVGQITLETAIYDPAAKTWSKGPTLPGKGMEGFGSSAFGTKDGLFVSTASGSILRLSDDQKQWEEAGRLKYPRMFHRMLALDDGTLLVVGGTARGGKVKEVETIRITLAAQ